MRPYCFSIQHMCNIVIIRRTLHSTASFHSIHVMVCFHMCDIYHIVLATFLTDVRKFLMRCNSRK